MLWLSFCGSLLSFSFWFRYSGLCKHMSSQLIHVIFFFLQHLTWISVRSIKYSLKILTVELIILFWYHNINFVKILTVELVIHSLHDQDLGYKKKSAGEIKEDLTNEREELYQNKIRDIIVLFLLKNIKQNLNNIRHSSDVNYQLDKLYSYLSSHYVFT